MLFGRLYNKSSNPRAARVGNFSPWNLIKSDLLKWVKNGDFRRMVIACVAWADLECVIRSHLTSSDNEKAMKEQEEERLLILAVMREPFCLEWFNGAGISRTQCLAGPVSMMMRERSPHSTAIKQRPSRTSPLYSNPIYKTLSNKFIDDFRYTMANAKKWNKASAKFARWIFIFVWFFFSSRLLLPVHSLIIRLRAGNEILDEYFATLAEP